MNGVYMVTTRTMEALKLLNLHGALEPLVLTVKQCTRGSS
jgi:hypothetical protein